LDPVSTDQSNPPSRASANEEETWPKEIEAGETKKPKFTFLKRGQGLSRFRLTYDDFQQQNQRIKATKAKPGNNKSQSKTNNTKVCQKNNSKKSVNVPKSVPPVKSTFTIKNNARAVENKRQTTQIRNLAKDPIKQSDGKVLLY
jgi:hypothetical protein